MARGSGNGNGNGKGRASRKGSEGRGHVAVGKKKSLHTSLPWEVIVIHSGLPPVLSKKIFLVVRLVSESFHFLCGIPLARKEEMSRSYVAVSAAMASASVGQRSIKFCLKKKMLKILML